MEEKQPAEFLILSFLLMVITENQLKPTGAIGYFVRDYQYVSENSILDVLNEFISDRKSLEEKCDRLKASLPKEKKEKLLAKTDILVKSVIQNMDFPPAKKDSLSRWEKIKENWQSTI